MRMQPMNVQGMVYSKRGLRFGWTTEEFCQWTEELEQKKKGAREEIVAEAHHLAVWPHHFAEVCFLVGVLISFFLFRNSLLSLIAGSLCLIAAFQFEVIRFYTAGTSPSLSYFSMIWASMKFPAFIGSAILMWPENKFLSVVLIVVVIVQGWLRLITALTMLPLRISATSWIVRRIYGEAEPITYVMESMSLAWVVDRWRKKHNLAVRSI